MEDYPEVCEWWREHNWPMVPLEILSTWGMIVTDGLKNYAAAWLYTTNSKAFTAFEWMVTNPKVSRRKSLAAVKMLAREAKTIAERNNFSVFTWAKSPGLIRLYQEAGFKIGDKDTTTMVLSI